MEEMDMLFVNELSEFLGECFATLVCLLLNF